MENVVAILTAAGSGTRLKEKLPKTLVSLSEESTATKMLRLSLPLVTF